MAEGFQDYIDKSITGNYQYFKNCRSCLEKIDIKHGIGNNFECPGCGYFLCWRCIEEKIIVETQILQNPALFKNGRLKYIYKCPECKLIVDESDVESFR